MQKTVKSNRIGKLLKAMTLSGDYAEKIRECTAALDWAMQVFQVRPSMVGRLQRLTNDNSHGIQIQSDINNAVILNQIQAAIQRLVSFSSDDLSLGQTNESNGLIGEWRCSLLGVRASP